MSEKNLYEKHLAEKLQQLSPPPDMEGNWQKMKALLDDEKPRGGGFGKRWWRLGVIAGILLIGAWLAGTYILSTGPDKTPLVARQPNPANVNEYNYGDGPDANPKSGTLPSGANDIASTVRATDKPIEPANAETNQQLQTNVAENNQQLITAPEKNASGSEWLAGTRTRSDGKEPIKKNQVTDNDIGKIPKIATTRNNPTIKNKIKQDKTDEINLHDNISKSNIRTGDLSGVLRKAINYSPVNENTILNLGTPAPADNLKADLSLLGSPTKGLLSSKSARAARNRSQKSLAIGLSLPLAFPLGDQRALSYNFNAGANAISDYIPSPHLQYRLSDKTYLQTELQFIAPQYIRPILLYETRTAPAPDYMVYNSVYARKLYYFNLPVGIHHSPFPHFYLGTGLQFSSLLSGVGLYEQTKRSPSGVPLAIMSERYAKLSGDSLTSRMSTSEVRLMLDVNYYVNRFTIGLRYNQAFNNYVSFRVNSMSPYTFDKNKALQFYLRYNLWENLRMK